MKNILLWVSAVIITLSAAVYQRMTGPTYPKRIEVELSEKQHNLKLIRSHGGTSNAPVELAIEDDNVQAVVHYRKFPTADVWKKLAFKRNEGKLIANLPNQPPAGKLEYFIEFTKGDQSTWIAKEDPIVIRFKGDVPSWVLLPHILFMFVAMLLSNLSGLMVIFKYEKFKLYATFTLFALLFGGMILGPIVQKYAFGEFWTGVPFGWDLTDNKTLIAFIFWILAVSINYKKEKPIYVLIASIVLFLIYIIPHSMFGSELDHNSGEIKQGLILFTHLF